MEAKSCCVAWRRIGIALAALALLAGAMVAAGCGRADSQADPVRVGLLISMSGSGGLFGPPTNNAAQLAIEQINEKGGVLGRKLELVVGDDQTNPQIGAQETNRLVEQEKVEVLVGMHNSATRDAVKSIPARANKLYLYTPVYEGTDFAENMFFLGEVPNQQLAPTIPYMMELTGGKKWYLIGDDYVWPQVEVAAANKIIEESGGTVVGTEFVPLGTSDFSSSVNKIQAADPDLIFAPLVGGDAVGFVKAAHDFGIQAKYLTPLMEENTVAGIGEQAAAGVFTALSYFWNLDTPAARAFKPAYVDRFGADAPPQTSLSEGVYEALNLWALAVEKAGSLDTEKVAAELGGLTYDGPRGEVTLDAGNHHLTQHMYLAEAQPDASLKVVKDFGSIIPQVAGR